jgi:hypothetical protein
VGQPLVPIEQIGAKRTGIHAGGIPQQYTLSDRGRAIILAEYDGTTEVIDNLVKRLRVPRYLIKRWAGQLGLARRKEPCWTDAEERYLESHLHQQSLNAIADHLGRTKVAVKLKAKRLGINKTKEGHTMRGLELALGSDHHNIEKWMANGWLKGMRRGSERTEQQGGDMWLFLDSDIRDFVRAHPLEIDQRRMDWLWMVDLLSGGIGALQDWREETVERVEGEMNLDMDNLLHFDSDSLAGKSIALLGITGSGKTNTAFVILDELLASKTAMTIVDIEGEYWQLAKRHTDMLIVGRSEHCSKEITRGNAVELAKSSLEGGIPILIDLSDYSALESHTILIKYFGTLWTYSAKVKRPYRIVLEEAHEWLPEYGTTDLKDILSRIALRGRKRGLDMMIISQRSAKVAKDVLTQTSLLFLHRVVHPIDLAVYKLLIPLQGAKVLQMVGDMQTGQAIVVHNNTPQVVSIRPYTSTPVQLDVKTAMRKRIKELEEELAEKDAMIADQADTIARLMSRMPEEAAQLV